MNFTESIGKFVLSGGEVMLYVSNPPFVREPMLIIRVKMTLKGEDHGLEAAVLESEMMKANGDIIMQQLDVLVGRLNRRGV